MKTVKQLIAGKSPTVWSIEPDQPVINAITLMADKKIGALLVTQSGQLCGIVSERDYARKVTVLGRTANDTSVSTIMSENVVSVAPDDTIDTCMQLMSQYQIRHLPVLERSKITGVLSVGDLVNAIIADQQQTIQQLEDYIMS